MKKILSLVLAALMVAAMLCACTTNTETKPNGTQAPATQAPTTQKPTEKPTEPAPQGPTVVTLADYFANKDLWEDDGGYFDMTDDQIFFDNFSAGDYAAVRMTEAHQDVTYKFNVTINKLAPVSMEDWTWWDSEFCVIARSTLAASSWQEDGSQKGYTLTWWGDMKTVVIGRCGYDEACGSFDANIGDGQPHDIEFTVINNADGTVSLKLVIDGNVVADVIDECKPREDKPDRPTCYPDAGGLTLRAKWLELIVK